MTQVPQWKCYRHRRKNDLAGFPGLVKEAGPERLMTTKNLSQATLQRGKVEFAAQIEIDRQVVGAAGRIHLIQKPEPLLRKRHWSAVRLRTPVNMIGVLCWSGLGQQHLFKQSPPGRRELVDLFGKVRHCPTIYSSSSASCSVSPSTTASISLNSSGVASCN